MSSAQPQQSDLKEKASAENDRASDHVAVEESIPVRHGKKVYRNYPGYMETPTCVNPNMDPAYATKPKIDLKDTKQEAERLAAEQVAAEKQEAERLAAEQAAAEKQEAERLAAEQVAAEKQATKQNSVVQKKSFHGEIVSAPQQRESAVDSKNQASVINIDNHTPGQVLIGSNGKIDDYKYFTLNDPPRLVVDVYMRNPAFDRRVLAVSNGFEKIRIGSYDNKVRVVFDADGSTLPEHNVEGHESDITVTWTEPGINNVVESKTDELVEQPAGDKLVIQNQQTASTEIREVASNLENQSKQELRLQPHFPSFVATLQETDLKKLEQLVKQVKSQKLTRVEVVGHTDNLPIAARSRHIFADNRALSEARARNVVEYLQRHLDIPAEIIKASGRGCNMPVADNTTETGRALNRRVDIFLVAESVETSLGLASDASKDHLKGNADPNNDGRDLVTINLK
jgi:flagellar motor protein MotB